MPTGAASWISTTVTAMMTVGTGQTSLTAVSALANGEEGRPGWEELLQGQGTGANGGRSSWQEFLDSLVSRAEVEYWGAGKGRSWAFWSTLGHCVHGLARDRRRLFPQPPTSPAALGSSCVTVACASMQVGAAMAIRTVMTSLMSATAVSGKMAPEPEGSLREGLWDHRGHYQ